MISHSRPRHFAKIKENKKINLALVSNEKMNEKKTAVKSDNAEILITRFSKKKHHAKSSHSEKIQQFLNVVFNFIILRILREKKL